MQIDDVTALSPIGFSVLLHTHSLTSDKKPLSISDRFYTVLLNYTDCVAMIPLNYTLGDSDRCHNLH